MLLKIFQLELQNSIKFYVFPFTFLSASYNKNLPHRDYKLKLK